MNKDLKIKIKVNKDTRQLSATQQEFKNVSGANTSQLAAFSHQMMVHKNHRGYQVQCRLTAKIIRQRNQ